MPSSSIEIVNLSNKGVSQEESRKAGKWMAEAFEAAPAPPALTIFFAAAPYKDNVELHEKFWASHLNRVAMSGTLLGVREDGEWRGFRCFFEPGKGRQPYVTDFKLDENEDWDRFLQLAGQERYMQRIQEWGAKTGATGDEIGLDLSDCFTTSIIVVDRAHQRRGIGAMLDKATQDMVCNPIVHFQTFDKVDTYQARNAKKRLFVRIHEYILPFYESQGYRVLTTPTYTLQGSEPFEVHFLMHDLDLGKGV